MPAKGKTGEKGREKCGDCGKSVTDTDAGVLCEICDIWHHIKCENVDELMYKALMQFKALHWYCEKCSLGAEKLMTLMVKMEGRMQKLEDEQENVKTALTDEMKQLETKINDLVDEVKENLRRVEVRVEVMEKKQKEQDGQTKPAASWSEIVKGEVENKLGKMHDEVTRVQQSVVEAKKAADEMKDRENRQNNIVIYNMPEQRTDDKVEWYTNERKQCMELLNNILKVGIEEEGIIKIIRLGKKDSSQCRPQLVQFRSKMQKNVAMENLSKLKTAKAPYNKVVVQPDLTRAEREECKQLVQLARKQTDEDGSGEWCFKVRGPPGQLAIVKMRAKRANALD